MRIESCVAVLMVLIACKGNGSESHSTAGSAASGSSVTVSTVVTTNGSSAGSGSAVLVTPLDPKIAAARCDEPCLFLVDTPIDNVADAYKAACGKAMKDFGFDDCKQLDQARKCVYAAHGFVFKQSRWKKSYERKPWYVANAEFKPTQVSDLERKNVWELDARAKGCKKGFTVSAADLARVKTWVAGIVSKQSLMPKLVLTNGEVGSVDEFFTYLAREVDPDHVKTLALGKGTVVYYDSEIPQPIVDAIKAPPTAKLRAIVIDNGSTSMVDKDNAITEGVQVRLVFDDHDQFLAIDASHYLWD